MLHIMDGHGCNTRHVSRDGLYGRRSASEFARQNKQARTQKAFESDGMCGFPQYCHDDASGGENEGNCGGTTHRAGRWVVFGRVRRAGMQLMKRGHENQAHDEKHNTTECQRPFHCR